ncbi:MAG: ribose 5-phosphate isomerase B [Christensenellales bacterium]|jgi:ribose 5-phosphate isomerase B
MKQKKIVIGCDNAAVDMKNLVISELAARGVACEDVGVDAASDGTFYPLVAKRVCERIIESGYQDEGILLCGTGIGMAMTANKFKGIFAAVCHDNFSAERARLSNDANVLCMGARVIGPELARKILDEWLQRHYEPNERSHPKVEAMRDIDSANMK